MVVANGQGLPLMGGMGRYVDVRPLHHGRFSVDFNYAYNPYCAYNPTWSCPIPPTENRLNVERNPALRSLGNDFFPR